jgi:phosphoribosyl 1,2-cyclic phosphodiesterase
VRDVVSLFARDVQVVVLASGSRGNCTYVGDGHAGVLVDCGISTRQVFRRLEEAGLRRVRIDAVLVTHEHSDHAGAARVLCARLREAFGKSVPFYMTAGTARGLRPNMRPDALEEVSAGRPFSLRHFRVDPFRVSHDTSDPVAYRVRVGGIWVGVVTDLGRATTLVQSKVKEMSVAVIEFNHDVDMLRDGPYTWALKQRIRSSHGHLSNLQAAELLERALSDRLEHLVLAHLSEDNNHPAMARREAETVLGRAGALGKVRVTVARQDGAIAPLVSRASDW